MAVEEDKKDIVDFLVKEGADTNIKDDAGGRYSYETIPS